MGVKGEMEEEDGRGWSRVRSGKEEGSSGRMGSERRKRAKIKMTISFIFCSTYSLTFFSCFTTRIDIVTALSNLLVRYIT